MAEGLCLSFRAKLVGCVVMMQQTTGVTDARPRRGGWGDLRGGGDAGLMMTMELQRSRSASLELILSPLIQSTYQWVSDPTACSPACLSAACIHLPLLCICPLLPGIQEHFPLYQNCTPQVAAVMSPCLHMCCYLLFMFEMQIYSVVNEYHMCTHSIHWWF